MNDPDPKTPEQYRGRTARYLALLLVALILALLLFAGAGFLLYAVTMLARMTAAEVNPMMLIFIGLTLFAVLALTIHSIVGTLIANDNIFSASGRPLEMARSLFENFFHQSQILLVVIFVGFIATLITGDVILAAEGLPVITGVVGFALGRQYYRRSRGANGPSD